MNTKKNTTKRPAALNKKFVVDGVELPPIDSPQSAALTLDDILNEKSGYNPFGVESEADLETKINRELSLADMQAMATRAGLLPVSDRTVLKGRLLKAFRDFSRRKRIPSSTSTAVVPESSGAKAERARKIMKEGM